MLNHTEMVQILTCLSTMKAINLVGDKNYKDGPYVSIVSIVKVLDSFASSEFSYRADGNSIKWNKK